MPRRKQPGSLKKASLNCVANAVLQACHGQPGCVGQYVQEIPTSIANEYVEELFRLISKKNAEDGPRANSGWLRQVFQHGLHRKCSRIDLTKFSFHENLYRALFAYLPLMPNLHVLKTGVIDGSYQDADEYCLPENNLRSVHICETCDPDFVSKIVQSSPLLEEISTGFVPTSVRELLHCACLRIIDIPYRFPPSTACELLDRLPFLESVPIDDIDKMLETCTQVYLLKDFVNMLMIRKPGVLEELTYHFPSLEQLTVLQLDANDLNPLNDLNLKNLTVTKGTAADLLCLVDTCFPRLTKLSLNSVIGLDLLFKHGVNMSDSLVSLSLECCSGVDLEALGDNFPNLESLEIKSQNSIAPVKVTQAAFKSLENLDVVELPKRHVQFLISSCRSLKSLRLSCSRFNDSDVCKLLQAASLKELNSLYVYNLSISTMVVSIILNTFGDSLHQVYLHSDILELAQPDIVEITNQLHAYDMSFVIESIDRTWLEYEP